MNEQMKEQMTMNHKKAYMGIDYFRFVAALLVVMIHTSPLASCSETADFFSDTYHEPRSSTVLSDGIRFFPDLTICI